MSEFTEIVALARDITGLSEDEFAASLARPGIDGRALDGLNKATWILANNLTGLDQRVEDVSKAEVRTQRLWARTAAEREALARVYGGEE